MALLDAFGADARLFEDLTDAQNQAITDGLLLVAYADGPATKSQSTTLAGLVASLPSFAARTALQREGYIRRSIARLGKFEGPQSMAPFIDDIAAALPSPVVRATLVVLGAALGRDDGEPSEAQRLVLDAMADALDVDEAAFSTAAQRLAAGV
jgi:hypothetical protein